MKMRCVGSGLRIYRWNATYELRAIFEIQPYSHYTLCTVSRTEIVPGYSEHSWERILLRASTHVIFWKNVACQSPKYRRERYKCSIRLHCRLPVNSWRTGWKFEDGWKHCLGRHPIAPGIWRIGRTFCLSCAECWHCPASNNGSR